MPNIVERSVRSILTLGPAPWRWKVGIEAALGLAVPAAILVVLGYEDESLMASMGAFTALYYATYPLIDRARLLSFVGAGFVLASALGTLAAPSTLLTMLVLIGLTAVTSISAMGIGLGSPGPMMFVLVAGVSNNIARSGAYSDSPAGNFTIPLVVALGAAGSTLVVSAPLILTAISGRLGRIPVTPLRELVEFSHWDLTSRIIAYRVIVAATIATIVGYSAGISHAYWIVLVAGVVLQLTHSLRRTMMRVVHRMLGTIIGLAFFALIYRFLPSGLWIIVILALLQGAIEIVVARNYGLALVFMTPLALTIATASGTTPVQNVIEERFLDTALGLVIALGVLLFSEWLIARNIDARGML